MPISNGIPNNRGQWSKTYSDGSKLYYSTYTIYNAGQGGRGLDPSSVKTYLVYERPRGAVTEWVTGGELSVDGKIIPLKNSQSFRVVDGELQKLGSGGLYDYPENDYVLGDLARQDLSTGGTGSLRYQTINNSKYLLQKDSGVSAEEVNKAYDISSNIKPPGEEGTPGLFGDSIGADQATENTGTAEDIDENDVKSIEEELGTIQARGKKDYEDVTYPIGLDVTLQDCIKFSIIKYTPSGLKGFATTDAEKNLRRVIYEGGNPNVKGDKRERLATIVLPIPGGIQDTNRVNWSDSELNPFMEGLGALAQTALEGGDVARTAQREFGSISNNPETKKAIITKFTSDAIKGSMIMQRQFGAIINPNMELLFNSPDLRTFSFSFKLSPRSSDEAVRVKKIIRNFKQAMSVKRSNSSFLLQTPYTFAISYVFQDKQHPYLNKFKECALTSCGVNYTPEGNYMSFDDSTEPSMVSYQLDLQFQELEPVYDDDYGNDYDNIGY